MGFGMESRIKDVLFSDFMAEVRLDSLETDRDAEPAWLLEKIWRD